MISISWPRSFWWFVDTTLIKPAVARGLCMLVAYGWNLSTYVYQYMGTSLPFINLLWNGDSKVVFILALSGLYQSLSRFTSWPCNEVPFPAGNHSSNLIIFLLQYFALYCSNWKGMSFVFFRILTNCWSFLSLTNRFCLIYFWIFTSFFFFSNVVTFVRTDAK